MTVRPFTTFTTGPSTVPDVGLLSYNGCVFSPLYLSNISGKCVKDEAQRTVKFMEYVITVDGYVTLPDGDSSVSPTMGKLKSLLTAQGGALSYQGRGNDIVVNMGASTKDAAWGPVPELLEFQPLGGGLSAKVKWTVKVHIVEPQPSSANKGGPGGGGGGGNPIRQLDFFTGGRVVPGPAKAFQAKQAPPAVANAKPPRMLQFNYQSTVSYGEDGFSTLSNTGILEIPLTRDPTQATRTFASTADDLRGEIERRIMSGIDLTRFRMVRRSFTLSRDKRTLTWDFTAEEKPYMDLPPYCTVARGSYSVRPARAGMGLATWMCTLRCTYTVRAGAPRRMAWSAFLALLRLRMSFAKWTAIPAEPAARQAPPRLANVLKGLPFVNVIPGADQAIDFAQRWSEAQKVVDDVKKQERNAWLMDFNFEEGIYLDSKTISFSASWRVTTVFSQILIASGLWSKVMDNNRTLWATTMKDIQGAQSWLPDVAKADIIVDFGGG